MRLRVGLDKPCATGATFLTQTSAPAIICSVCHHGEHGAIVRTMTPDHGLMSGYVRGGRSRTMRPILVPGNRVAAEFRARTADQLAGLSVELSHSVAPLLGEPLAALAIDWSCALTAAALPEENSYPALYRALDGVLSAIEHAPAARVWAMGMIRYETLVLAELGFGLDLSHCTVTGEGAEAIRFVSPRTGAGVSAAGAAGYEARLLRLPMFLRDGSGEGDWSDILDGLALTAHFLTRSVLIDRRAEVLSARERLIDRLKRAVA